MPFNSNNLYFKSKLYVEKAFELEKKDVFFGLWIAMSLELLARAAISNINPILLLEQDKDSKVLLAFLKLKGSSKDIKSINISNVFRLCKDLIKNFDDEKFTTSIALLNVRNQEIHSALASFNDYPYTTWLAQYYEIIDCLCNAMEKSLEDYLGIQESNIARQKLSDIATSQKSQVIGLIRSYNNVFSQLNEDEQLEASNKAREITLTLVTQGHHKVSCPACNSDATVTGVSFGQTKTIIDECQVEEKTEIIPNNFSCNACRLKLSGNNNLNIAGIGEHFYSTRYLTPAEYYDLYDEDSLQEAVRDALLEHNIFEFNNE